MKVVSLYLKNFRGIRAAQLYFDGHALLVGMNNVGKSTVCEALELALGLDRLKRFPPVEEFDFYNAYYIDKSVDPPVPVPIEIEVVLTHLPDELATKCFDRLEHW
jgi:putative ATP-dependent endonuclease of OLD family